MNEIKNYILPSDFGNTDVVSRIVRRNVTISNVPLELDNLQDLKDYKNNKTFDKIVMLTFTSECTQLAIRVAQIFREEHDGKKIGVFMAHECSNFVNSDYYRTLSKIFKVSDYVIPILTLDYFNTIDSLDLVMSSSNNLDTKYCKFIYTLMTTRFEKTNFRNDKVRCLIFDEMYEPVSKHSGFKNNPLFSVWFRYSEIEDLAKRILERML